MDCISLLMKTAANSNYKAKIKTNQQGRSCAITIIFVGHKIGLIIWRSTREEPGEGSGII